MALRRHRAMVRAPSRRQMVWFSITSGTTAQSVAAQTAILMASLNTEGLDNRPFTIVRSRGIIIWESDQAAATETPFGVVSLQVVTEAAALAGIASVPTPTVEFDADFHVYEPVGTSVLFADATGVNFNATNVHHFDSKAQRKVGVDDDVVLVAENESSVAGAECIVLGRFLIKLH